MVVVIILVIVCLIVVFSLIPPKKDFWEINESDILEAKKLMNTEFYKKLTSEIYNQNIKWLKEHIKDYGKLSIYFTDIRADLEHIYTLDFDGYDSTLYFKDIGYAPLENKHQIKILLYALSKCPGYKAYEVRGNKTYSYACVSCDYDYWKRIYDKHMQEENAKLKKIF